MLWVSAERLRDSSRDALSPANHGMPEPARGTVDIYHADAVSEQVTLVIAEVHVFPALPEAQSPSS